MKAIKVNLGRRSYRIIIGHKILSKIGPVLKRLRLGKDAIAITNPRIWTLYGSQLKRALKSQGIGLACEKIPPVESSKSNTQVVRLLQQISRHDKRRGTFIIALGGGVVGDVAGFVASIYKRGIPYIQVPTTLLGQVDSAIGGKVAIDLDIAKNLVGAFYQPRLVVSDTYLLRSLPTRQVRTALAEIIKYGVIADPRLFAFIEKNIKKLLKLDKEALGYAIQRCSRIKARIVEKDEKDTRGVRAILNYGHTVGHAIETAAGYSKQYTHGEAIAIGMVAANEIAVKLGMLKPGDKTRIESLIRAAGLPVKIRKIGLKKIMRAQSYDKKIIHGVNRFVLPVRIGKVKIREGISKKLIEGIIKSRS